MLARLIAREQFSQPAPISITGSKSESNRLLILKALYPEISIENLSESDDTRFLRMGLTAKTEIVDVHHAGTAMRFLTAYFATQPGRQVVLTGSERMQQRPIKILVDALRELGAQIEYLGQEGFPPLRIAGVTPTKNEVTLQANVSSQYISALMLVAPTWADGLKIHLQGKATSVPYIEMTLALLKRVGIEGSFSENTVEILQTPHLATPVVTVESDWSSASYFFSIVALHPNESVSVTLRHFYEASLQGDAKVAAIYEQLGVLCDFRRDTGEIVLTKTETPLPEHLLLHLVDTPDIAQTIAVTCFGLGMGCRLTGLHTLKIKETDRLAALKTELEKLGGIVTVGDDFIEVSPLRDPATGNTVHTYNDHRMAMAFAPLAFQFPIQIEDPMVVTKSYPTFWDDMEKLGLKVLMP